MSSANPIPPSADIEKVKAVLRLFLAANKHDARGVEIRPAERGIDVQFLADDGNVIAVTKAGGVSIESLADCMLERSFSWPVMHSDAFQKSPAKQKSLLLAPVSGLRAQCFVEVSSNGEGDIQSASMTKLCFESLPGILDQLQLSAVNHEILSLIRQQRNGIVAVNSSDDGEVYGAAVLLALRPDALYLPEIKDAPQANTALELAGSNLVICGMPDNDALDAYVGFAGLTGDARRAGALMLGSFVHRRISRVCSACARPTQAAASTLEQIPELLRPLPGSTYMFGRGCDACGHTTYRGTIGIETAVRASNSLRKLLSEGAPVDALAQLAYQEGTRTLLEDGLQKIRQGLTSYESLNKAARTIPAVFEKVVADARTSAEIVDVDAAGTLTSPGVEIEIDPTIPADPRILIVEDDPDQRKILQTLFRAEGYEVFEAEHGKAAMEVLEQQEVDLVIADLMMPHMNGSELVKEIRSAATFAQLPILMLTAVDNPDAEYALLDAGADGYCPKNVKRKVLLKRVERLLSRS